eukprot:GFUD01029663.1.p1 GENE.GFUD01029663.1~~GFUD01029663.1.p1  ORF type:complete len:572 (+),score=173.88 GFUD01029663.1:147-1862(+)
METSGRMERQLSNVGSYYFKHDSEEEIDLPESEPEETSVPFDKDKRVEPISNLVNDTEKLYRKSLNYSQEDIHALASKAEMLVLKTSAHNDSGDSGESDESDEEDRTGNCSETSEIEQENSEPASLPPEYLQSADSPNPGPDPQPGKVEDQSTGMQQQEENSLQLSGTWDHDLQEQYLSEGSTLGSWDNSMKSVLCFGEDYSNYIRRRSELPSLENIQTNICGLEGSPRNQKNEDIDPIILLRMSERDWINAVHELKEKKETNFGEQENYERMITTCNVNLEILRSLDISPETNRPKCLPQDHKDLMDTWERLHADLNKQASQCQTYNKINCQIEKFSTQLADLAADKAELDCSEEVDVFGQIHSLQSILSLLEAMRPTMLDTSTTVHQLLSSVSSTKPEDVQKISLVCFCKQELILLNSKWEEAHSEASSCLAQCEDSLRRRQSLERDIVQLEHWVRREHWVCRTFSKSSLDTVFDKEKISNLKQVLKDLNESRSVSKSYFDQSSKYLDLADTQLVVPEDPLPCVKAWGDSYLPLLVVTTLVMFSYYYPVNWWERACRLYQLVSWSPGSG